VYVDPDVQRLLDDWDPAARDVTTLTPEQLRANAELTIADMRPAVAVAEVRELSIATRDGRVAARLYRPHTGCASGLVVYCHGGGWELGSLELSDRVLRRLCRDADVAVLSVDYRLTPEHPFPAALHDCYDATVWAAANAAALGAPLDRLVVAGDSAGANLAAAVAQLARDTGGPRIHHQFLIYPVVSRDFSTDSYRTYAEGYFLTRAAMEHFWTLYVGDGRPRYAELLSGATLHGLPSATVVTCTLDPLCSEGQAYARALTAAGVPTLLLEFSGLIHGIWYRDGVSTAAYRFGATLGSVLHQAVVDVG